MARISKLLLLALAACFIALCADAAESLHPLDLKPYVVTNSWIEKLRASWLLPHGAQVLDGIPFQIDGTVLLYGTNSYQRAKPGRTNVTIAIKPMHFERLHFLGATDSGGPDGISSGRIHLFYADGSDAVLDLRHGNELYSFQGAWHKAEVPITNPDTRRAWVGQNSGAAETDRYLRLYHASMANPSPEKEVRSIALESAFTQYGLMVLGLTAGPATAEKLPDTIPLPASPFPDTRPRNGDPAQAEGWVKTMDGKLISGARIYVAALRPFGTQDRESDNDGDVVGNIVAADDSTGHFALPGLPDNRLYRVIAFATGYYNETYRGIDPKSDPVEIRMTPAKAGNGKYAVHSRVVGPDGKPVAFALVEIRSVAQDDSTISGGSFSLEVFTDTDGKFTLSRKEPFDSVHVFIRAPHLAMTNIWLDIKTDCPAIALNVGNSVHGRVVKDGKPVPNTRLTIAGHNQYGTDEAGEYHTVTKDDGTFLFEHLPANHSYDFYGPIAAFKNVGALPPRLVQAAGIGQTTELGDAAVARGLRLAGQIKTRNGGPLPKNFSLRLGYYDVNDSIDLKPDQDGKFEMTGLTARPVYINFNQEGWRLSPANRSLAPEPRDQLSGQLTFGDKGDLLIDVERTAKRARVFSTANGVLPAADNPYNLPLWGAEPDGPPYIVLAGRVVDDKSGRPIPNFTVIPGLQPPIASTPPGKKPLLQQMVEPFKTKTIPWDERIFWEYMREQDFIKGTFSVSFVPLSSQPLLRIEAPGYAPLVTPCVTHADTNLLLRLQKRMGPNGIVEQPDGKPAAGAELALGVSGEQFQMEGKWLGSFDRERVVKADENGKYSLELKQEDSMLFVSHTNGWAQLPVAAESGGEMNIRLKSWAYLEGTLMDSNGVPAAGIRLRLTMEHAWTRANTAMVDLENGATTDTAGHFLFSNVPPTRLEVQRMVGPRNGMSSRMQTWLFVQPGITNQLGNVTMDHPPPDATMMEQLKSKIGL